MGAPGTVDDLGVRGCLALAALLLAHAKRLPVAPTASGSLLALELLRQLEVIEVPWPQPRWSVRADAEITPIEAMQWAYAWPAYLREGLPVALEEYLQTVPRDEQGLAMRVQVWRELVAEETERFYETQLVTMHFDPHWAGDARFAVRQSSPMSLAQWRYCVWAAARHGASKSQRDRIPDPAALREGMFSELLRRARRVASGHWVGCALSPC